LLNWTLIQNCERNVANRIVRQLLQRPHRVAVGAHKRQPAGRNQDVPDRRRRHRSNKLEHCARRRSNRNSTRQVNAAAAFAASQPASQAQQQRQQQQEEYQSTRT
jgi:phage replication-related protein YjqB (UPF0714/DUF867 family)